MGQRSQIAVGSPQGCRPRVAGRCRIVTPLPLSTQRIVVTGANAGLGFACSEALARDGAEVVFACRNEAKARAAMARIERQQPDARLHFVALDLSDLASVRDCARAIRESFGHIDGLCNNAGIMGVPRQTTRDGFERHLGTNYLGHFALTGLLMPALLEAPRARVVSVTSLSHHTVTLDLEDLQLTRGYGRWRAYARSKLANLMFSMELHRRCTRAQLPLISAAAHPGYAATDLLAHRPEEGGPSWLSRIAVLGNTVVAQSAVFGALPILACFRTRRLLGGEFFGPDGWQELAGQPSRARPSRHARDPSVAAALWDASVELTGVSYEALT